MKMTIKQKAFCDYYIQLGNATEAYIRAGYSASKRYVAEANARRLLANDSVKGFIAERLKQIEDERVADAAEVMKYLTSVLRGESESEIVVVEGKGDGISKAQHVTKAPDEKERLKAAELLGKRYGLYVDRIESTEPINITIRRKSDAD